MFVYYPQPCVMYLTNKLTSIVNQEYEFLHLVNGLSALLVHNPKITDQLENDADPKKILSAAALCVNVGSFSDPKDADGLAHFLEHMLFMGSAKFPEENDYDSFLAEHGWFSNACTGMEYITYYFSVHHSHLKPALDRFSQFFISPLIKMDSLEREVQAVDSEFAHALQSDGSRLVQLQRSTADPLHPYHHFAWGNQKSLTDANKSGDIREKLFSFYKQHYLADRMKLVVIGGEPLETLRGWVLELFKDVPRGGGLAPRFECDQRPWPVGKLYHVESVSDQNRVVLSWPMPCLDQEYLKMPHDYLAKLIVHQGAGSLFKLLKQKNWAFGVTAGASCRSSAGYVFCVDITLTLLGLQNIFDIICHFYEYVRMLQQQGPQEWFFKETQTIADINFRFLEEEDSHDDAVNLSKNMHLYPPHHTIYGDYAYDIWDADLIDTLLNYLSPGSMRVDVVSKTFDFNNASDVQMEPWFRFPYTVEEIPENVLRSWASPLPNTSFHLPPANDFICSDFSMKHCSEEHIVPFIIFEDPSMKVWYKLDRTFLLPNASVYVHVTCNTDSVRSLVLNDLYTMLLNDAADEILYMAGAASLCSKITGSIYNIQITASGYNEKLKVLMKRIAVLMKRIAGRSLPKRTVSML